MAKLPNEVIYTNVDIDDSLRDELLDSITDKLSDDYGFCLNGYSCSITIKINDIDWDTDK